MIIEYISIERFVVDYSPLANPFDLHAPFCWGRGYGTMLKTLGAELEFVRHQPKRFVWTLVSVGEVEEIHSGLWRVNRLGYFVTQAPCPETNALRVHLETG